MSSQDGTLSSTRIINSDTSFKTLTSSVGNLIKSSETWMRTAVGTPNTFRSTITVFSSLTNCSYNSCTNTRDEVTKSEADNNEAKQGDGEEENIAPEPEILLNVKETTPEKTNKQTKLRKRKPFKRHKKYNLSCTKLRNYRKAHVKIKKYVSKKLNAVDKNALHVITGSMSEISHSRSIKKVLAKVNLLDDKPVVQNIPTEPEAMPMSDINTSSTESEINHINFTDNPKSASETTLKEEKFASTSTSKANVNTLEKFPPLSNISENDALLGFDFKELTPKSTPHPPLTLHKSEEQNVVIKDTYTKLTAKDQGFNSDSTDISSFPFIYTDSSGNSTSEDKAWQATSTMPCSIRDKTNDGETIPAEGDGESRTFPDVKPAEAKLMLKVDNDETLPLYCDGKLAAGSAVFTKSEFSCGLEPVKPHEELSHSGQIIAVLPLITHRSEMPLTTDQSLKITDSNKVAKARSLFQCRSAVTSLINSKSRDSLIFKTNSVPKYPSKAELPIQSQLNISDSIKLLETPTITTNLVQQPFQNKLNIKLTEPQTTKAKRFRHLDNVNNKSEVVLRVQDMSGSTVIKPEAFACHSNKNKDLGNNSFATTSSESEKSHLSDFNDLVREQTNAAVKERTGELSNYIKQQLVELGMNADSVDANSALKEKVNESVYDIEDSSKMVAISNQQQPCPDEFRTVFPTTLTELWDRLIYAIELSIAKAEKSMTEKVIEEVKKLHSNVADKEITCKALSGTAEGDVAATSKSTDRTGLTPVQCLQCDIIDGQIIDHMVQIRNKVDAIISDCLPTYSSNSLKMKDLKLSRDVFDGVETPEKIVPRSGEGDVEQQPPESPSFQLQHVSRTRYRIVRRVVRFIVENSLVITTVPTLIIFFLLMYSLIAFLIRM